MNEFNSYPTRTAIEAKRRPKPPDAIHFWYPPTILPTEAPIGSTRYPRNWRRDRYQSDTQGIVGDAIDTQRTTMRSIVYSILLNNGLASGSAGRIYRIPKESSERQSIPVKLIYSNKNTRKQTSISFYQYSYAYYYVRCLKFMRRDLRRECHCYIRCIFA